MLILGIDTSCDDTSVALLENGRKILSHVVSSQADLHGRFGGVVPEIASRKHVELIDAVYDEVLSKAGAAAADIDLVGVTAGPGLIGSVLVGLCFAKGLCFALNRPFVGINHIEAHAMSIFLERDVEFPFLALVVSGGHTIILLMEGPCNFRVVGSTRDDAAGEAFDKIAKFLGIGYPGGRTIEEMARRGIKDHVAFPRPMMDDNNCDFSFSGLKTAFLNYAKNNPVDASTMAHVLASFQEAICDVLVSKTFRAARRSNAKRIVVGGGVAANGRLREVFFERAPQEGFEVMISSPQFCTDNGAMVALLASFYAQKGALSPLDIKGYSRMAMR
ncbi:MAG TPA: tRNA (adenosine(37)-N6)-threonylcarbamoyltransferase complex transferase subunit TsaD [Syntrophorhabdaceae bacterium]|nr:tRNA (adenosine(37)-N6)-threonylcarbamoyltransferase complex transferase subunit TsaD [Syntrophorhabdaceae bacterium]